MPLLNRDRWPRWARAAMSPWLISPVLVLALLVGAYLSYGAYTRSKPTHYQRGGDAFGSPNQAGVAAASSASPPSGTTAKKTPPRQGKLHAGGATAGGRLSRSATTSGGSTSHGGGTSSSTSGDPAQPSFETPRTGSYRLAVSGSEDVRFGPFAACSNSFPDTASMTVQHALGEPGGSYDFDLRLYPSSPNRHDERHIYRYTSSGVTLNFEQATVTCGGVKQASSVNYSPPQQRVRFPLSVGSGWHDHGGDSSRTEDGSSSVVGTAYLTYNGRSYLTYVIDTHLTMSGDESGSRDQRWWYSPDLGLPLRWHESLSGKRSGATYSEDVTITVVGGP